MRERYSRFVTAVAGFATLERIRIYTRLMVVLGLGIGLLNLALGRGLLDAGGNARGADFLAFYTGANLFLEGRLVEAYDFGDSFEFPSQLEFQRQLALPEELPGIHAFVNPPYAAVLYVPFGSLPYPVALSLWWLVGLLALGLSAWLLRGELGGLQRYSTLHLFAGSFLFFPTIAWLAYGQITSITLLLYTATFVSLRRGRDFAAGACLGCLAYKPQLALVLALVLILKWRWRALAGGALAVGGWVLVGMLTAPEAMVRYLETSGTLLDFIRYELYPTWGIHSVFGFTSLALDSASRGASNWGALLICSTVLLILGTQWWNTHWAPGSRRWDLLMASTITFGLMVSPHLFLYDLMLLLLPFALVLHRYPGVENGRPLDGGPVLAWSVLLWAIVCFGSYLSKGQLELTEWLGWEPVALQLSTLVILAWSFSVLRLAIQGDVVARCRTGLGMSRPDRVGVHLVAGG